MLLLQGGLQVAKNIIQKMFIAQIKKVEAKNLASLDKGISILLYTDDVEALDLGKIKSDRNVKVIIQEQL